MRLFVTAAVVGLLLVGLGLLPQPIDAAREVASSIERSVSDTVGSLTGR